MTRRTRVLPALAAGSGEVAFVTRGWSETFEHDLTWNEHSHPFHELLWNERGASTAVVGSRVWTVTPSLGLWMPAGTMHSGSAIAGTWCRAIFFAYGTMTPISPAPAGVEITPLLRLLLERLADAELPARSRAVTEAMVLDVLAPSSYELLLHVPTSACSARSPRRSVTIRVIRGRSRTGRPSSA
ncbi:AraC family ligand binding domain-containing protein [Nonomuraea rubra]